LGIVASLNRPGGNITGVTSLSVEILGKRIEVLRELVPKTAKIGLLVNPNNPNTESSIREVQGLALKGGWIPHFETVGTASDIENAFAMLAQAGVGAALYATDALFSTQYKQLVALAESYHMPFAYPYRDAVESGGLLSYGVVESDAYRQAGIYAGRILKGEKPADLPVQQATRIELAVNLNTAKALGLTIPELIMVRADKVIE
jgi:putative ABC transport system substrate-binding protein